ncbi:unnamed protein product [Schistosoma intercalatum]|nr:unnamed protein product [Schistosoma intercalatum]
MYMWDRVTIRNGLIIQTAVVTTRTPVLVFLWYHVQRRGRRTYGLSNNPKLHHVFKFSLSCLQLVWWKSPRPGANRWSDGNDVMLHMVWVAFLLIICFRDALVFGQDVVENVVHRFHYSYTMNFIISGKRTVHL